MGEDERELLDARAKYGQVVEDTILKMGLSDVITPDEFNRMMPRIVSLFDECWLEYEMFVMRMLNVFDTQEHKQNITRTFLRESIRGGMAR